MTEAKFSPALETLVRYAKNIGDKKNAPLTAERFLVAVIDSLWDIQQIADHSVVAAANLIKNTGADLTKLRQDLMVHIKGNVSMAFLGDLHMKRVLTKASALADGEIDPGLLTRCIMDDPTEVIRKLLGKTECNTQDGGSATGDTAARQADLEQKFDRLFEQVAEAEAMAAAAATPPAGSAKDKMAQLTQRVKDIRDRLSQIVFGQDNAINVLTSGYFQAEMLAMTDKKRTKPGATFLFAGPPGVGKTYLAESAAKVMDLPFQRFDMSEYCENESAIEFCGSDKVYKNSKPGNFTSFVSKNPKSVVLFDEIEKAHLSIIHLFLQILDAGRIRDNHTDEEISLKDVIMIFTTNAGKQLYTDSETGDFSTLSRKVILKALQRDINPETGNPFFPAAICSRFASGNVVMFNHMSAHNLRDIAKKEVLRHAENFQKEAGVQVQISDAVYSALLFAEGGAADARTVRGRAEAFFDDELYELFRLTGTRADVGGIRDIETIHLDVELPEEDPEIRSLFVGKELPRVMVFAGEAVLEACDTQKPQCRLLHCTDLPEAIQCLRDQEVKLALVDMRYGRRSQKDYLNLEDMDSLGRDCLRYLRENCGDLPIYLLQTPEYRIGQEEQLSFMRQGVRGVLTVSGEGEEFADAVNRICEQLHQQESMNSLAKSNKLVSFETAQRLSQDGKIAKISLFDFRLSVAMDAEDSKNVMSNVSKPNVTFDQVIGADDAKQELKYFVEYLRDPKKYLGTGVRPPKGVLLYGPPGTGKTLLAKAMATEAGVTFIAAEGNEFLKPYIGEGQQRVHELFRTARKYAPAILFVDEIDAVGMARGGDGTRSTDAALTAFLTEMDGFHCDAAKPVFVLAATNADVTPGGHKSLDAALMRRFDRKICIDLPNKEDRIRYMKWKMGKNPTFAVTEDKINNLAVRSTGMSLAELESVLELSLRMVIRAGGMHVTDEILDEAFETFHSGEKKQWDLALLQRVARHEAGHAFLCWHSGETPSYLTVVARAGHGGYMRHGENEDKNLYTKDELLALIRTSLGGRAAELLYYGPKDGVSTGASGDLASATRTAQHIVCSYGMDDNFGLAVIDPGVARGGELSGSVRNAVNQILAEQMTEATRILTENQARLDRLVEVLMEKNHLTGNEIQAILEQNP